MKWNQSSVFLDKTLPNKVDMKILQEIMTYYIITQKWTTYRDTAYVKIVIWIGYIRKNEYFMFFVSRILFIKLIINFFYRLHSYFIDFWIRQFPYKY